MANIRTLADLRKEDEEATLLANQYSHSSASENYENQPIAITVLEILFPHFFWKSSLLFISILQWCLFIATLVYGSSLPLTPSSESLVAFGGNFPPLIVKGQVWRLFCPIFLHASFIHILFNVFFQLRMGFVIEKKYKIYRFLIIYILTGIAGNIFSAVTMFCGLKVGASTAGFGMIGVQIAELALSWHIIRHRDRTLLNILVYITISSLLIFSMNGDQVDQMGHLGGFIAGVCLGLGLNHDMENKPSWYKTAQYSAWVVIFLLFAICVPLLFALKREC